MALNFPGPYEMRFFYTVDNLQHVQKINCDVVGTPVVGEDSANITLQTKDSVGVNMETAADAYGALWQDFFDDTAATLDRVELWRYAAESTDATYISSYDLALDGESVVGEYKAAQQVTLSFRTQEGGIMRLVYLETPLTFNVVRPIQPATALKAMADYVVASDTWMLARDTSYPVVGISEAGGENEAIWRKRYR